MSNDQCVAIMAAILLHDFTDHKAAVMVADEMFKTVLKHRFHAHRTENTHDAND